LEADAVRPSIPPDEFAKWLRGLPPEILAQGNREPHEAAVREYEEFTRAFREGRCDLCDKPLTSFSIDRPCLHWFLAPKGFEKKHFSLVCGKFGFFQTISYLRWVASVEGFGKNVNDLTEEHHGQKLVDFTAKYKELTWSFSCGESDYSGHAGSQSGNFPHYHFQMMLGDKAFIRYNDFHIPLSPDDCYDLDLFLKHKDTVLQTFGPGAGMRALLEDEETAQLVIDQSTPTDPEKATFHIQTLIRAPEGKRLSGDALADAVQEAKRRGCTVASILREYLPDAEIVHAVSPGDGVVDAKPRSPRRKKS
jgi:hypothetical protein